MNSLVLIGSFNAFFFAVLILKKSNRWVHDKILLVWLLILGLYTGVYGLTSHFLFIDYPFITVVIVSLLTLYGPLYFMYVKTLSTGNKPETSDVLHFIPFFIFELYLSIKVFKGEISEINLEHANVVNNNLPIIFTLLLLITAISGPVYYIMSISLFKKLHTNIANNFSSAKEVDPAWLRKLSLIFGIIWTALISVAIIHHVFGMFSLSFCLDGLALSLSVLVILLGYFGIQQKQIFVENDSVTQPFVTEPYKKYASSGLKKSEAVILTEKLNEFMDIHKPWLDSEITLPKLAENLGVSSHHLSRVINENLKSNFFDIINKKRVEEVVMKINDPLYQNYTLLGIAFECGFNSKTAFNRLFKKYTGLTPSSFKENMSGLILSK